MEIYTDGSRISGKDGNSYAGCGIWFGINDIRNTHVPILKTNSTNQLAELLAVKYALQFCKKVADLIIKTDSAYSINCITVWSLNWQSNNWKTAKNKEVLHAGIIQQCIEILSYRKSNGYSTQFIHVSAHSGILGNEQADRLAKLGSTKAQNLLQKF